MALLHFGLIGLDPADPVDDEAVLLGAGVDLDPRAHGDDGGVLDDVLLVLVDIVPGDGLDATGEVLELEDGEGLAVPLRVLDLDVLDVAAEGDGLAALLELLDGADAAVALVFDHRPIGIEGVAGDVEPEEVLLGLEELLLGPLGDLGVVAAAAIAAVGTGLGRGGDELHGVEEGLLAGGLVLVGGGGGGQDVLDAREEPGPSSRP